MVGFKSRVCGSCRNNQRGAGFLEVAILIGIIAVTAMAALRGTGENASNSLERVSTTLKEAHGSIERCPTWPDC